MLSTYLILLIIRIIINKYYDYFVSDKMLYKYIISFYFDKELGIFASSYNVLFIVMIGIRIFWKNKALYEEGYCGIILTTIVSIIIVSVAFIIPYFLLRLELIISLALSCLVYKLLNKKSGKEPIEQIEQLEVKTENKIEKKFNKKYVIESIKNTVIFVILSLIPFVLFIVFMGMFYRP